MFSSKKWSNLVIFVTSLLLSLVGTETLVRKLYYPSIDVSTKRIICRSEDPELIYEMTPGAETVREGVVVRINSDGFRDDPFSQNPRDNEFRIIIMGDSVTAGWGVEMADAFPQILEKIVNNVGQDRVFTVLNMGVYGYSTKQELRLLETRGLKYKPDLIIVVYHLNDPDVADAGQARYFTRSPIAIVQMIRDKIKSIDSSRRRAEYHHYIHKRYAQDIRRQFCQLGSISRNVNVPVLVVVLPLFSWKETRYPWLNIHLRLKKLCMDNGLLFLDLFTSFRRYRSNELSLNMWHPNKLGHRIIAESIAAFLLDKDGEVRRF